MLSNFKPWINNLGEHNSGLNCFVALVRVQLSHGEEGIIAEIPVGIKVWRQILNRCRAKALARFLSQCLDFFSFLPSSQQARVFPTKNAKPSPKKSRWPSTKASAVTRSRTATAPRTTRGWK